MITPIGAYNKFTVFGINFKGNRRTQDGKERLLGKNAGDSLELSSKGKKARNIIRAKDFPKEVLISNIPEVIRKSNLVIDEVNSIFKEGDITREDGSRTQIVNTGHMDKELMYEYSDFAEIVRRSTFEGGRLAETRMPLESKDGKARQIIIQTYKDGKTLKMFEIKRGERSGEGEIEVKINFDEDGHIASFMG